MTTLKILSQNNLILNNDEYKLIKSFHAGKSGVSHLYISGDKKIVFKQFLEEKESYIPFEEKLKTEVKSYKVLESLPIKIPKLIYFDKKNHFLIKEFIEGELLAERVASNKLRDETIIRFMKELKYIYQKKFNIDYFPNNFVFNTNEDLYYIDYEIQPYTDEWNFENWGIFYWLNSEGVRYYLQTGSADKLNYKNQFKPIQTDELTERKNHILNLCNLP